MKKIIIIFILLIIGGLSGYFLITINKDNSKEYKDAIYLIYKFTDLGAHGIYLTALASDRGQPLYTFHVDDCSNKSAARSLESCEVLEDRKELLQYFNSEQIKDHIEAMIIDCASAVPRPAEVYECEDIIALAGVMDDKSYAKVEPVFSGTGKILDKFKGFNWNWSCDRVVYKRMKKIIAKYDDKYHCSQDDLLTETRLDKFRSLLYPDSIEKHITSAMIEK